MTHSCPFGCSVSLLGCSDDAAFNVYVRKADVVAPGAFDACKSWFTVVRSNVKPGCCHRPRAATFEQSDIMQVPAFVCAGGITNLTTFSAQSGTPIQFLSRTCQILILWKLPSVEKFVLDRHVVTTAS